MAAQIHTVRDGTEQSVVLVSEEAVSTKMAIARYTVTDATNVISIGVELGNANLRAIRSDGVAAKTLIRFRGTVTT